MKIPYKVGIFRRYKGNPTTMEYGIYYDAMVGLPFSPGRRHVRVWLPGSYDFANPKPHPVIYFSDGQNLVDYYLTAYGDWHLDRVVRELGKNGYPEPILVGIDCPKNPTRRCNELNPPYPINRKFRGPRPVLPYANRYLDFIRDELKPYVDEHFCTDTRWEATGIGGSSMGGIMSFYAFLAYSDVFGYSLSFSPALFFYTDEELEAILEKEDPRPEKNAKMYLYVGGKGFEKQFIHATDYAYGILRRRGFKEDKLHLTHDPSRPHHEEAWADYSYDALAYWLKDLQ